MPFQGNPRAGAPDPAFLQFLFNRRDARAKAERQSGLDQAKAAAEAEKAGREKQLFDIELATKRIDALDKLNERREGVAAGQRAIQGKLQPEDIAQPQGEGLLTDDSFASIVGGLDPQGVAAVPENAFRRDALASEVDQLAQLRGVVTGQGVAQSRDVISGQGSLATAALEEEEGRELSEDIAAEKRAIQNFLPKAQAQARADIAEGDVLLGIGRDLKNKIRVARAAGDSDEVASLQERLDFAEQLRIGKTKKGQISVINPPSPDLIRKVQISHSSAQVGVNILKRLQDGLNSGTISAGVKGSIRFGLENISGIVEDLTSSAEITGEGSDILQGIADQARTTSGSFEFEDSNGEQLTLTLDSMALAWQYVKSLKNSARITLLEFETALKQLGITGLTVPEARVRSALRKVAEVTIANKARDEAFLRHMAPGTAAVLDSPLSEEDQTFLDSFSRDAVKKQKRDKAKAEKAAKADPSTFDNLPDDPTDEDLFKAMDSLIESQR